MKKTYSPVAGKVHRNASWRMKERPGAQLGPLHLSRHAECMVPWISGARRHGRTYWVQKKGQSGHQAVPRCDRSPTFPPRIDSNSLFRQAPSSPSLSGSYIWGVL